MRRRLLLAGVRYAAPAVLVSLMAGEAYAQTSCGPSQNDCQPLTCGPAGTCDPDSNCAPFEGVVMGMM